MMRDRCVVGALLVLVVFLLGCVTVELVPSQETPLRTVAAFPTATRSTGISQAPTPTATVALWAVSTPESLAGPSVDEAFFAAGVSGGREPVNVMAEFPSGTTRVYAFVAYAGMANGLRCESVWYANGQETARNSFQWALGQNGQTWVDALQDTLGLPSGRYNWELWVEGELLAGEAFSVGTGSAGTPLPQPTSTTVRVTGPRILFVSMRDLNNEIYIMKADGGSVTRLTNNPAIDYDPACSPDGTRVAFMSRRDGNNEIYLMNSDGAGVARLTNTTAEDWDPAWSPDGRRIAFVSDRHGNAEIYAMNSDGSGIVRLTNDAASDRWPSWSPDGSRIVFTSYHDGNDELFIVNALGRGSVRLTSHQANDWDASWSPDGTRIAYVSSRDGNEEIYVMNASGGGVLRLTSDRAADTAPAWSPDGARIAFVSNRSGNEEIYVMNSDGTGVTRLTNNSANDWDPSWCPS